MTTPSRKFAHELDLLHTNVWEASEFFYTFLTIQSVIQEVPEVLSAIEHAPLFWYTTQGALHTAMFIALGRVFDQGSPHNLDRVLRLAQDNQGIFSKAELGRRKQSIAPTSPPWLENYLRKAYVPTPADFHRLRAAVVKWRRIYVSNYRDIRHKRIAHTVVSDRAEIDALFAKTNVQELERMLEFLGAIHEALQGLFDNGRKPVLSPRPHSLASMRAAPASKAGRTTVQEQIVHETEAVLLAVSRAYADKPGDTAGSDAASA